MHFARPAIDVLMESAADAYGPGLAGILLTGANHDGAAGMAAIHAGGGLTVVQDPRRRPGADHAAGSACAASRRTWCCRWPRIGALLPLLAIGEES